MEAAQAMLRKMGGDLGVHLAQASAGAAYRKFWFELTIPGVGSRVPMSERPRLAGPKAG